MKNISKSFTLVELLVVVSILAILAGGAIAVFDGVGRRAAKGQAINDMAQLTRIIKNFQALQRELPSNFDSLLKSDPVLAPNEVYSPDDTTLRNTLYGGDDPTGSANFYDIAPGDLNSLDFVSWLHPELTGSSTIIPKILRVRHSYESLNALVNAGIRQLRFVDKDGDHNLSTGQELPIQTVGGGVSAKEIGRSLDVKNPSQVFEQPIDATDPTAEFTLVNLGRGFSFNIVQDAINDDLSILSNKDGDGANAGGEMV